MHRLDAGLTNAKSSGVDLARVPVFAPASSREEQNAREVGDRVQRAGSTREGLTSAPVGDGSRALSAAGREFYRPFVGSAVERARLHISESAASLARAFGARAFTRGRDVYVPPHQFRPDTSEGRALLGHELSHVTESNAASEQVFRAPEHYPSVSEQRAIERDLGRNLAPTPHGAGGARGRSLSEQEVKETAGRVQKLLYAHLDAIDGEIKDHTQTVPDDAKALSFAQQAQVQVKERYGAYLGREVLLVENGDTVALKAAQVPVSAGLPPGGERSVVRNRLQTGCAECKAELESLDDPSKESVIERVTDVTLAERHDQIERLASRSVQGLFRPGPRRLFLSKTAADPLGTAVHEVLHAYAHPVFVAAFLDEAHIMEGFAEYFTQQITGKQSSGYASDLARVEHVKERLEGPVPGGGASAEESMRLAYFKGRLDLIGWKRTSDTEWNDVQKAGGAVEWNAQQGQLQEAANQQKMAEYLGRQRPRGNTLGTGVFIGTKGSSLSLRYARVLTSDALARNRLVAEAQVLSAPLESAARLGGSLGLGYEFQSPYLYFNVGARVGGSAARSGEPAPRVDLAAWIGAGVRLQPLRVGVEGILLLPLTGEKPELAVGATVGVEF